MDQIEQIDPVSSKVTQTKIMGTIYLMEAIWILKLSFIENPLMRR